MGLATGFVYCTIIGQNVLCTHVLLAGVCFGTIFKPPLSGYDVCAAMSTRYLAAPRIVASSLKSSLFDQTVVFPSQFRKKIFFKKAPIISEFYVKVAQDS